MSHVFGLHACVRVCVCVCACRIFPLLIDKSIGLFVVVVFGPCIANSCSTVLPCLEALNILLCIVCVGDEGGSVHVRVFR